MKIPVDLTFPTTIEGAKIVQNQLRSRVIAEDHLNPIRYVAGVDVGFEDNFAITRAAVVVLSSPDLTVVETQIAKVPTSFPYIPGFLSFREIPAILKALAQLQTLPDLILCDGQGYAHPRRFGIACHLGVLIDCPTIGVAKSRLIGTHREIPVNKGEWIPLQDGDEIVGAVLRSRSVATSSRSAATPARIIKPLYISIGHRISLATAIDWVLRCTSKYRLPEPTRLADKLASQKTNATINFSLF